MLEKYKDRFQGIEACSLQEVNPVGQSHNRPLKTVLISGVDIAVLGTLSSFVEDENENEIMTWHALGHWDENIVFGAKIES